MVTDESSCSVAPVVLERKNMCLFVSKDSRMMLFDLRLKGKWWVHGRWIVQ